ncbi:heme anaerobic degradation radical SAM methyltransferase ChuW/HutW [Pontiella agarivorans]|uniref:Heme anaerobic degradation radical SAM methyltransferase ChuW/HutW n=1 Tax=Pontiella agarivorans TaxID=3038953 RepID=A0ABU5MVE4_9BACT|nr:heme anaerobic degradation radical SAM methyltransferase ChuW/HutW [Pontiella agarivorans]MDZ8118158.1 heme anaerobic degradation radical SAM methyltransferase ChuW/HutW [Pontiella agarivorans]
MIWTEEAEELLGAAPAFVRGQIREKTEAQARGAQRTEIDAAFVKSLQSGGRHPGDNFPPPRVTEDPIHGAFDRKYGVHAGMSGGSAVTENPADLFFQCLENTADTNAPAMAYLHVPFCCTRCLFCGFYAETTEPTAIASYTDAVVRDIELTGSVLRHTGRKLSAVYFGGGTPTDLQADELDKLIRTIRRELPLTDDCEITVEGRLYDFTDEKVSAALDAGANRFSFGVQSFDTKIRRMMGRILGREELIERLNRMVELGDPYNAAVVIDLIYALPGQREAEWVDSIDCGVNETGIHGLDLYQINLLPATPLMKKLHALPPMADLKQQADLFLAGRARMMEHGFDRLSIAHWGRDPRERNRYNLWNKRDVDCVPLGAGAGGRWSGCRFFQQSDVHRFSGSVAEKLKPVISASRNPACASVIAEATGQIEQRIIDIPVLEACAGRSLGKLLFPMLGEWKRAGLLEGEDPFRLTAAGEFWSVNLQKLMGLKLMKLAG